jgi:lysophospholipase L1-like esterase
VGKGEGWFDRLAERYPDTRFDNQGVPGAATGDMLYRFRSGLAGKKPDYITILGGGNDILQGLPVEGIVNNIRQIVDGARSGGIVPILLLPLLISRRPGPWGWVQPAEAAAIGETFGELRQALRRYAEEQALLYFDPMTVLEPDEDGENYFLADGIHIDGALHERIASGFKHWRADF